MWGALFTFFYLGWGAVLYRLFLRQAIAYKGVLGYYPSDLPTHISEGMAGTWYSLIELSFGFLMNTLGLNQKAVSVLLVAIVLATVWVTYRLMCSLVPQGNKIVLHLLAIVSMIEGPIYIQALNPYRYLGLQSCSIWHNSTFLGMKLAGTCVLLFYYGYQETYQEKFSLKDFVWFTLLLTFVNLCKPSFIVAFAPAMAVMLLTDCISSKGKTLGRQIVFGIPVLISLFVLLRQSAMLFSGENAGSSIGFSLAYILRLRTTHPVVAPLQSAAFPLVVLFANLRDLKKDRRFRVTWLIWLFGLLEYLFLNETGPRQNDGNLTWSYCYCLFPVFVICVCWLYRDVKSMYDAYRASESASFAAYVKESKVWGRVIYLAAAILLLAAHLYFGLDYFRIIYLGGTYY